MPEKRFRTHTGYCHITPDKIIWTKEGVSENVANEKRTNTKAWEMGINGAISAGLATWAYMGYTNGNMIRAVFFGVLALGFLYAAIDARNYSDSPVVDRKDIRNVKFKRGSFGRNRSTFTVEFNENGRVKKKLIIMPGHLNGDVNEAEDAIQLMREEKLMA